MTALITPILKSRQYYGLKRLKWIHADSVILSPLTFAQCLAALQFIDCRCGAVAELLFHMVRVSARQIVIAVDYASIGTAGCLTSIRFTGLRVYQHSIVSNGELYVLQCLRVGLLCYLRFCGWYCGGRRNPYMGRQEVGVSVMLRSRSVVNSQVARKSCLLQRLLCQRGRLQTPARIISAACARFTKRQRV